MNAPAPPAPRQWTVPLAGQDDSAALAAAGAACRDIAAALDTARSGLAAGRGTLGHDWTGAGAAAALHRLDELDTDLARLAALVGDLGTALTRYATSLAAAHHRHRWSLGRILTVAAVVVTTTASVVVTLGATAPEVAAADAAVVDAEVATAGAAVAEATGAAGLATRALAALGDACRLLRGMAVARRTTLIQTEAAVGLQAGYAELRAGRLDPRALVAGALSGLVVPEVVGSVPGLAGLDGRLLGLVRPAVTGAATTAADEELASGRVVVPDVVEGGLAAGGLHGASALLGERWTAGAEVDNPRDTAHFRGSGTSPRQDRMPGDYTIDLATAPEVLRHPRYGIFAKVRTRDPGRDLFVTPDLSGHGASRWKLYSRNASGLNWQADLDRRGDWIEGKHKSAGSKFLPLGQLRRVG